MFESSLKQKKLTHDTNHDITKCFYVTKFQMKKKMYSLIKGRQGVQTQLWTLLYFQVRL